MQGVVFYQNLRMAGTIMHRQCVSLMCFAKVKKYVFQESCFEE